MSRQPIVGGPEREKPVGITIPALVQRHLLEFGKGPRVYVEETVHAIEHGGARVPEHLHKPLLLRPHHDQARVPMVGAWRTGNSEIIDQFLKETFKKRVPIQSNPLELVDHQDMALVKNMAGQSCHIELFVLMRNIIIQKRAISLQEGGLKICYKVVTRPL